MELLLCIMLLVSEVKDDDNKIGNAKTQQCVWSCFINSLVHLMKNMLERMKVMLVQIGVMDLTWKVIMIFLV
jgi:hypothetical protein